MDGRGKREVGGKGGKGKDRRKGGKGGRSGKWEKEGKGEKRNGSSWRKGKAGLRQDIGGIAVEGERKTREVRYGKVNGKGRGRILKKESVGREGEKKKRKKKKK